MEVSHCIKGLLGFFWGEYSILRIPLSVCQRLVVSDYRACKLVLGGILLVESTWGVLFVGPLWGSYLDEILLKRSSWSGPLQGGVRAPSHVHKETILAWARK